jgi:hypothetical protein
VLPREPRPALDWNRGKRQPTQLRLPFPAFREGNARAGPGSEEGS